MELVNKLLTSTTTTTTVSTTSSITATTTSFTTSLYRQLKNVMPAKIKVNPVWQQCKYDRDCVIVSDCCGVGDYGYRYTISSHYGVEWDIFLGNWCMPKDHRLGCGWLTPNYSTPRCENKTCILTYGGFDVDNLTDNPIYNWSWVQGNLQ